ncbi:MAG TPA: SRPBCC family protein [Candidatus Binatia bacterium]|jgi:hypothetical protein
MLRKILLVFAGALAAFVVLVATRPDTFHLERSTRIDAPPDIVFAQVNDFKNWDAWSPWAKLDPNMTKTLGGPPAGVGATYAWSGNSEVGEGRMAIVESTPSERVGVRLEFVKPFAGNNLATFTFVPQGGSTNVTWAMDGERNFVGKAIGLFLNVDSFLGPQFEKGLAQMKTASEARTDRRPG